MINIFQFIKNELTTLLQDNMKTTIVVLGSPNDEEGNLLPIAIERCKQALIEYKKNPHSSILCTGGFGEHFNTTKIPHGEYTQRYLIHNNIPTDNFLSVAQSGFTLEDAKLSIPILEKNSTEHIILITSDFHMPRAEFVFTQLMPNILISLAPAHTNKPLAELALLHKHEKNALKREQATLRG
jgi:uncharacterized SAM-binding protein YcdF (DUF218 family)